MLTGFLRNDAGEPVVVTLKGAEESVLKFKDLEGNSVLLNNETAVTTLGLKIVPVVPVTNLRAEVIIE